MTLIERITTEAETLMPENQQEVLDFVTFLKMKEMPFVMLVTILLTVFMMQKPQSSAAGSDARLAMVSVSTLALGYLVINLFSSSGNISGDVCTTLFGSTSILTLTQTDVALCVGMSLLVLVIFVFFYQRVFAVTFDETFCRATGVDTKGYNLLMAVIIAVIIVLSMELVGSLLTSALIIFPAISSMKMLRSFRSVVICSAILSVVSAVAGIVASILYSTPVGSTIVAIECVVYVLCAAIGRLRGTNG